jgi:hypothetical protein
MVRSSAAESSSDAAMSVWPNEFRRPQRPMLATQSRAKTGSPSWNFNPSRRVGVYNFPCAPMTVPSTICG